MKPPRVAYVVIACVGLASCTRSSDPPTSGAALSSAASPSTTISLLPRPTPSYADCTAICKKRGANAVEQIEKEFPLFVRSLVLHSNHLQPLPRQLSPIDTYAKYLVTLTHTFGPIKRGDDALWKAGYVFALMSVGVVPTLQTPFVDRATKYFKAVKNVWPESCYAESIATWKAHPDKTAIPALLQTRMKCGS